jgi:hypothetical protein
VLAELDGTVLVKPFAAQRIKLYHYRDITKPIIRIEWNKCARDNYDILDDEEPEDEDEFDNIQDHEISRIAAYKVLKVREGPKIPHPWELRGKQCNEYWQKVYENWKSGENEKRLQKISLPNGKKRFANFMKTLSFGTIVGITTTWILTKYHDGRFLHQWNLQYLFGKSSENGYLPARQLLQIGTFESMRMKRIMKTHSYD